MKSIGFVQSVSTAALIVAATASHAQDWPKGPVRVVVPFAAGSTPRSASPVSWRTASRRSSASPCVVENKGGAAGNIGTDVVAKAKPDGQTIGVSIAGPLAVNPLLFRKMPYDPVRDLALITIAATQPAVLVVANKVPASDIKGVIEYMQKNRGDLSFSSVGSGSITHLAMQALSAANNAEMIHVPYPGSGAALTGRYDR